MDFSLFHTELFSIGEYSIKLGPLVLSVLIILGVFFLHNRFIKSIIKRIQGDDLIDDAKINLAKRIFRHFIILLAAIIIIRILSIDYIIYRTDNFDMRISHILLGLVVFEVARILDWLISNIYINKYYFNRDTIKDDPTPIETKNPKSATRLIQYIFYLLASIILLHLFEVDYAIYSKTLPDKIIEIRFSDILAAVLIVMIARLIIWIVTQLVLYNFYRSQKIEVGAQFAINQLLKYVIYIFAFILALENLGIQMTILLGGAAALLVGVGLGLQQTFNDFTSGIVLLFERSVAVGDILEAGDKIGIVKQIGMRSSILETRGNVSLVVPNSKLVNESIINWTHFSSKVRFSVDVGVAYGCDTKLVKKLLLEIANDNPYVLQYPAPFVRFQDFGDSSLNMSLFFFSRNCIIIEDIKSDIRFNIDAAFRENEIIIPFPQRDLWIKSNKDDNDLLGGEF